MEIDNFTTKPLKMRWLLLFGFFVTSSFAQEKPEVVVSGGHTNFISCMDITRDGSTLVTGSLDLTIKLWDVASGREYRTIAGFDGRINDLKIDPQGKYVAAFDHQNFLTVLDMKTGATIFRKESQGHEGTFGFLSSGEELFWFNGNGGLEVIDFKTGVPRLSIKDQLVFKAVLVSEDQLYVFDYKGFARLFSLKDGAMIQEAQVFDQFEFSQANVVIRKDEKQLAYSTNDGQIAFISLPDLKVQKVVKSEGGIVKSLAFDQHDTKLFSCDHGGNVTVWDSETGTKLSNSKEYTFGAQCVMAHTDRAHFMAATDRTVRFINSETRKEINQIESKLTPITKMAYDDKGRFIAQATSQAKIRLWDLEQNKVVDELFSFFPVEFTPDGKMISMYGMNLQVYDPVFRKVEGTLNTENELIQNLNYSSDGKYISGAGFSGVIKIWDRSDFKLTQKLTGHVGGVYATAFHPNGKLLASGGMDQSVRIWDLESGKEIRKIEDHQLIVSDVGFTPDGQYFISASWDKTIRIYNAKTWELVHELKGHTNSILAMAISPDGKILASASGNNSVSQSDNNIRIWNIKSGVQICVLKGHVGNVNEVTFDQETAHLISASDDGMIKIWNPLKCSEIATVLTLGMDDFIIVTPEMYYMASKDALDYVSFRINNKLYPFEQFDLKLNRPDIVSSRIGKTPSVLVNAYAAAYQKRLKRMNFTEEMLGGEFSLPNIEIMTKNLPLVTKASKLSFKVRATDENYLLDRINVYVNDVPVYGLYGVDLRDVKTKDITYQIDANLMAGKNKVQVTVLNEKGAESLKETFEVIRETEALGDLYIISIGVSEYQNKQFNLTYPAKDAKDVAQQFKNKAIYQNVYTKELLNKEVTRENFQQLMAFLQSAGTEDVVVLFIAGHGVLDEELNYYFGTHNMDFDDPGKKGLSYEEIEGIFYKIKALKKLLIMDTCHSGEVDKDEVEKTEPSDVQIGDVKFRAAGQGVRAKDAFGLENSYDLMQALFSDIRKGTGATVISSAGGAEYAMESDEWKNGLFTFCLLQGLVSNDADLNHDGEVLVSELRKYVYQEVSERSNGKQRPTTRIENISLDYRVW